MKNSIKIILTIIVLSVLGSCEQWTETESKYEPGDISLGINNDEAYYANLRAYKATMFDRKLSWGWFGGWTGVGASMLSSLNGLPDSLDIAAIWGDWRTMTDARKADLERTQKIKGTKVVVTELIGSFNWRGLAPEDIADEDVMNYWGWEGELDPKGDYVSVTIGRLYTAMPTPAQEAAIRKYARTVAENILSLGYDGYDIDYEIGWGSAGNLVEYSERLIIYVDELGKYMGPKSGTDKLLIFDGAICNVPEPIGPYCNLFVIQAYTSNSYNNLNTGINRFSGAVNAFKNVMSVEEIAKKTVMTEDYENSRASTGGVNHTLESGEVTNSVKGMALWQPTYNGVKYERSGGFGAYHIEYEYNSVGKISGFYPWIREAIQTVNPAAAE
ncbi:MAG: glycoside hydrolase family 18 [Dysgonamonadaceae bacterium]|jgi:hypothetical protein|nr:glycoside hydrolase family 18 [Dysgonamonadaceae bacterium]